MPFEQSFRYVLKDKDGLYFCYNELAIWFDKCNSIWDAMFFENLDEVYQWAEEWAIKYDTIQRVCVNLVSEVK